MTDKELLEMAAKAAGIEVVRSRLDDPMQGDLLVNGGGRNPHHEIGSWNPLADDGDALRLAVKRQIQITPGTYNKDEFSAFKAAGGEAHEFRHYQQDEFAATRRAIVRAAAEIGKAMDAKN